MLHFRKCHVEGRCSCRWYLCSGMCANVDFHEHLYELRPWIPRKSNDIQNCNPGSDTNACLPANHNFWPAKDRFEVTQIYMYKCENLSETKTVMSTSIVNLKHLSHPIHSVKSIHGCICPCRVPHVLHWMQPGAQRSLVLWPCNESYLGRFGCEVSFVSHSSHLKSPSLFWDWQDFLKVILRDIKVKISMRDILVKISKNSFVLLNVTAL